MNRRSELRLILRAILARWDVPEPERLKAMQLVREVLDDATAAPMDKLEACRVAVAAMAANIEDEHAALRRGSGDPTHSSQAGHMGKSRSARAKG